MTEIRLNHNTASLTNVAVGCEAMEVALDRGAHLPGAVVYYGPSGYGKSQTAKYLAQHHKAYYIEIRRTWTRAALLDNILHCMGIPDYAKLTMPNKLLACCEQLGLSGRPLILDEMDNIVDRKNPDEFVELVRDLIDGSQGAVMLIGEEKLPHKLKKWERLHNRVLGWYQALPASVGDCKILAEFYYPELEIGLDLLEEIQSKCNGVTRRICINLAHVANKALELPPGPIGSAQYSLPIFTGEPPKVRG